MALALRVSSGWMVDWLAARAMAPASTSLAGFKSTLGDTGAAGAARTLSCSATLADAKPWRLARRPFRAAAAPRAAISKRMPHRRSGPCAAAAVLMRGSTARALLLLMTNLTCCCCAALLRAISNIEPQNSLYTVGSLLELSKRKLRKNSCAARQSVKTIAPLLLSSAA